MKSGVEDCQILLSGAEQISKSRTACVILLDQCDCRVRVFREWFKTNSLEREKPTERGS